jgi:hypothetical protein
LALAGAFPNFYNALGSTFSVGIWRSLVFAFVVSVCHNQTRKGPALVIALAVVAFIFLTVAIVLGFFAGRHFRRASLLGIPVQGAGELESGLCKVRGRIVALGQPMHSPVTNQSCVYYRLHVAVEHRKWVTTARPGWNANPTVVAGGVLGGAIGGLIAGLATSGARDEGTTKIHQSWVPVLDDACSVRLAVEDSTGKVEVDLRDASVVTKKPYHLFTDLHRPAPQELADFLQKEYRLFMVDDNGRIMTMKIEEEKLKEGAKVTVLGTVEERSGGRLCFRPKAGPLLVSERDLDKEHRSARKRAIVYAAAAAGSLAAAAALLIVALVATG